MNRFAIILSVALANPALAAKPERQTKRVVVNGATYRVTRIGDGVIVANKALSVAWTLEERDAHARR